MALLGKAAIAMWCDIDTKDCAEHDAWHSQEHLPERLSLPGFLRARRATTLTSGIPRHFVLYEVEASSDLTSSEYLSCLNNPTPWTRKIMSMVRRFNRTPCTVVASFGGGTGGSLLTLRFGPALEAEERLRDALCARLKTLAQAPGILGTHLFERKHDVTKSTNEHELRGGADDVSECVLVIEAYERSRLEDVLAGPLSPRELEVAGAAQGALAATYELAHIMAPADLRESATQGADTAKCGNLYAVKSLVC